ncbi:hypothetical protein GN958_ATG13848 [Phytophthora infestans]|uniref:Uncharacterized protein n=1 Tax=Phytophthora infestans TaxID=4787 RepID=A0A8S9U7U6_PHYIN|nr:hypothetical protein GN958_ATG13848 [Phytophthora infestans]
MWRRSLSLRTKLQTLKRQPVAAHSRFLSSVGPTPEEQEMLNEPREAMDYDVLLVGAGSGRPLDTPVTKDKFLLLTEDKSLGLPHFLLPREEHNEGNSSSV